MRPGKADSRWYRPPELLWGARHYSTAVDIWSMGTIMVELVLRVPFLAGESDLDQLKKTFHAMGTPTEQDWPVSLPFPLPSFLCLLIITLAPSTPSPALAHTQGHTSLPDYAELPFFPKNPWWNMVSSVGRDGQDLVREMLRYDPLQRVSAKAALHHRFFTAPPRPTPPILLPKPLAELRPRELNPQDMGPGPGMSAAEAKRKVVSPNGEGELGARSIARRLFV